MNRTSSRLSAVIVPIAAAVAVAVPAYAAWSITATNPTASATANALNAVTGVGSTVTSSSVTLTWTAPTGVPATGYTVTRTAPTSAAVCTNVALTTCTDTLLTGSTQYTYSIVALRGLWTSPAATHSATTSLGITRTFSVSVSGAATAGAAKSVSLTAQTNGITDATYTGSHTLTFSGAANGPNGDAPTTSQAVTFSAGVGTASLTFYKAETFTLTVSEASPARSGTASVTTNAALPRLSFAACTNNAKTAQKNTTFTTTVTRTGADPYGNSTGTAAATVTLSPFHATNSSHNFTTQTLSFAAGALTTSASAAYETANGNGNNTITGSATGYADASCTVTTTN